MKEIIDNLDSISGWSGAGGASVYGLNELTEFIAGPDNNNSIIFKWDVDSSDGYVEKTINFATGNYRHIVFHIWSRNLKARGISYRQDTDFVYKIDFGDGQDQYLIPTLNHFHHVSIYVKDAPDLERIRITALHDQEDYLIMSYMVASIDHFPHDIFVGFKEQIEKNINQLYDYSDIGVNDKGLLIESGLTMSSGDTSLPLFTSIPDYLEKYAVVLIDDGTNSETHIIDSTDEKQYNFGDEFDGSELLNSYVDASVYLIIPVEYGLGELDIRLPGVSIWGFALSEELVNTKEDTQLDSMLTDGSASSRLEDMNLQSRIQIDTVSRSLELLAMANKAVRRVLGQEVVWINGKRCDVMQLEANDFVPSEEGYNEIPKGVFNFGCQIKEEIWNRARLAKTNDQNITVTIQELQSE